MRIVPVVGIRSEEDAIVPRRSLVVCADLHGNCALLPRSEGA